MQQGARAAAGEDSSSSSAHTVNAAAVLLAAVARSSDGLRPQLHHHLHGHDHDPSAAATKWHPDKCGGGSEAAKARFHKIQAAYAVLSDPNKRILYDVGAYDSDADDEGAGDILGDILEAMNHTPPHEKIYITSK
ncbi:uncharacterized protein [Aegilops tauschii subsp. strangulata]|nr:uncharacterized protein LOC109777423 isoform X2 [Aegilops tauschii subsp. strangulata]